MFDVNDLSSSEPAVDSAGKITTSLLSEKDSEVEDPSDGHSGHPVLEHVGETYTGVLPPVKSCSKASEDDVANGCRVTFGSSTSDSIQEDVTRHHGLLAFGPSLHISVSREIDIQETDDNAELIHSLHDQWSLLANRYLPAAKKWLDVRKHSLFPLQAVVKAKFEITETMCSCTASTTKYVSNNTKDYIS
jgi:hypothetical protein